MPESGEQDLEARKTAQAIHPVLQHILHCTCLICLLSDRQGKLHADAGTSCYMCEDVCNRGEGREKGGKREVQERSKRDQGVSLSKLQKPEQSKAYAPSAAEFLNCPPASKQADRAWGQIDTCRQARLANLTANMGPVRAIACSEARHAVTRTDQMPSGTCAHC